MSDLHQRIANLSPEKRALFDQILMQRSCFRSGLIISEQQSKFIPIDE